MRDTEGRVLCQVCGEKIQIRSLFLTELYSTLQCHEASQKFNHLP
jgi:hypothetical protein